MARKFLALSADYVVRLYKNCQADLQVLPCSRKVTEADARWWGKGLRRRLLLRWLWRGAGAAGGGEAGGAGGGGNARGSPGGLRRRC